MAKATSSGLLLLRPLLLLLLLLRLLGVVAISAISAISASASRIFTLSSAVPRQAGR